MSSDEDKLTDFASIDAWIAERKPFWKQGRYAQHQVARDVLKAVASDRLGYAWVQIQASCIFTVAR